MSDSTVNIADRAKRIRSPKFGEIAQVRDLIAGQENVVNLGYGEPGFATPKHIRDAAKIQILVNPLMPSRLQECCWPRRSLQSPWSKSAQGNPRIEMGYEGVCRSWESLQRDALEES